MTLSPVGWESSQIFLFFLLVLTLEKHLEKSLEMLPLPFSHPNPAAWNSSSRGVGNQGPQLSKLARLHYWAEWGEGHSLGAGSWDDSYTTQPCGVSHCHHNSRNWSPGRRSDCPRSHSKLCKEGPESRSPSEQTYCLIVNTPHCLFFSFLVSHFYLNSS